MTQIRETSTLDQLIAEHTQSLMEMFCSVDPVLLQLEKERRNAIIRDQRRQSELRRVSVKSEAVPIIPLATLERTTIVNAYRQLGVLGGAKALGIGRNTLYRKLKEYGVDSRSLRSAL